MCPLPLSLSPGYHARKPDRAGLLERRRRSEDPTTGPDPATRRCAAHPHSTVDLMARATSAQAARLPEKPVGYDLTMRVPLNIAARVMACCVCALTVALALIGCGAGQITQTDRQVAAVDGAFGNVGNAIALRNV